MEEGGKERIEAAIQELTQASHQLAEVLYQKRGGRAAERRRTRAARRAGRRRRRRRGRTPSGDDVIDARGGGQEVTGHGPLRAPRACGATPARRRSAAPTRSAPASSTPTSTRATPWPPSASGRCREAFEVLVGPPAPRRLRPRRDARPRELRACPRSGFEGFDFSAEVRVGSAGFHEIFAGVLGGPREAARRRRTAARTSSSRRASPSRSRFHGDAPPRPRSCASTAARPARARASVAIGPVACPRCAGTGQVRAQPRPHDLHPPLRASAAARLAQRAAPAPAARARAGSMQSDWLDVEIPRGRGRRQPGAPARLRQRRPARGGPPGDFVLVVQVEPHPFFRREGDDLHCEVPVTITEAALGAHVEVPTPEGPVTIEMPAGTQTGQRFRLRKRGLPRLGRERAAATSTWRRGCGCPRSRDDESRELLREFARRNPDDPRRQAPARARRRAEGILTMPRGRRPASRRPTEARPAPGTRQVLHDQRGGQELRHPPPDPAPLRARGAAQALAHRGQHAPLLRGGPAPARGDPEPHPRPRA